MSSTPKKEQYTTSIWNDIPSDNPFIAEKSLCHGYDVFGDILQNGHYLDYLYLLLTGNKITTENRKVFEALLIALAHPGLRDPSVRAAMNAGVGGSRSAAALIAALSVGAGQFSGAQEVKLAMDMHLSANQNFDLWTKNFKHALEPSDCDVWLQLEHVPGFNPHQKSISTPTLQLLEYCAPIISKLGQTNWLLRTYKRLEQQVGYGLSFTGAIAAILVDLKLSPNIGEYFFLFSRLPGAAMQAQETREQGFRQFPFYTDSIELKNDPGPSERGNMKKMHPVQDSSAHKPAPQGE